VLPRPWGPDRRGRTVKIVEIEIKFGHLGTIKGFFEPDWEQRLGSRERLVKGER
jgi:hypothetical protein